MNAAIGPAQPKQQAVSKVELFRGTILIPSMQEQIKILLPPNVPVERFTRVLMTTIQKMPSLLDVDRTSLLAACLDAAKDGLMPDGKEAAIRPAKGKALYIPMVTGILKKIRNSGELGTITANLVYDNDKFRHYTDETGEHIYHEPDYAARKNWIGAYCLAIMKDGFIYFDFMTKGEIIAIRDRSDGWKSGAHTPWKTDEGEMAKKTVVRRLSKTLPMSTDIEGAFNDLNVTEEVSEPAPVGTAAAPQVEGEPQAANPKPVQAAAVPRGQGPSRLKAAITPTKPAQPEGDQRDQDPPPAYEEAEIVGEEENIPL